MKRIPSNLLYLILLVSGGIALYEQSGPNPRMGIVIPSFGVFLFGLMAIAARIPSKNNNDGDGEVQ